MRFINVLAYSCAKYLSTQLNESHQKKSVYYYGLQAIIGSVVDAATVLLIALIAGSLVPSILILITFATLRLLAGGFHMNTFGKCFATTVVLFTGAGIFAQYSYKNISTPYLFILLAATSLVSIFVVVRWAPKDTPNKPITKKEEIFKYKKLSLIYIVFWTLISCMLLIYGFNKNTSYPNLLFLGSCMGVLLEIFMVSPLGYGFLEKISGQKKTLSG